MIYVTDQTPDVSLENITKIENLDHFRGVMWNEFFDSEISKFIEDTNKKILWVFGTPQEDEVDSIIEELNTKYDQYDTIVFDDSTESYHKKDIISLHDRVKTNIIFIHGSTDPKYDLDYMVPHPGFLQCEPHTDLPFEKRSPLFGCLSRMLMNRQQRMMITLEIYKRGLLDYGVVSCGSGETREVLDWYGDPEKFPKQVYEKYKDFFQSLPIIADIGSVGAGFSNSWNHLNNPSKNCLINVVVESSGENRISREYPNVYFNEGWDTWFITEKTMKFINCRQIPIFLSTKGYVGHLRSLGFDVFDDFVDHSYDTEENQDLRIKMIVDELERLINKESVDNIIKNEQTIRVRMNQNISSLKELCADKWNDYYNKLFSQLSK